MPSRTIASTSCDKKIIIALEFSMPPIWVFSCVFDSIGGSSQSVCLPVRDRSSLPPRGLFSPTRPGRQEQERLDGWPREGRRGGANLRASFGEKAYFMLK